MNPFLTGQESARTALADGGGSVVSYEALREQSEKFAAIFRRELGRGLVFFITEATMDAVALYLGCLSAECPVCLLQPDVPLDRLINVFRPDALLLPQGAAAPDGFTPGRNLPGTPYHLWIATGRQPRALHPELALLLTTSGSTGAPKLVRLSLANLLANARSIAEFLGICPEDRAIQSLPMGYSYGLSVLNSHLIAGASVVQTGSSILQREFWDIFNRLQCTSIAGVPYSWETLHRLRFDPARYPTLRTMTQAGGALRPDLIRAFYEKASASGRRFFVMYGQTEATARISYVPWENLGEKIGSIGIAIPGGRLWLDDDPAIPFPELLYSGPNVMMGYASDVHDLALGDSLGGVLRTGDLAERDADGFFFLRGRLKRFAKLYGKRVNLEDMEQELERTYPVSAAVLEHGAGLRVVIAPRSDVDTTAIGMAMARQLNVPPPTILVEVLATMPLTSSGKKDYGGLSS